MIESLRIELNGSGVHVGLAYVGFTENDPDKTFLSKDGTFIQEPERTKGKADTRIKTASKLIRMVEKRQYRSYFTMLGKLNYLINRMFPFILHRIFLNVYRKDYT